MGNMHGIVKIHPKTDSDKSKVCFFCQPFSPTQSFRISSQFDWSTCAPAVYMDIHRSSPKYFILLSLEDCGRFCECDCVCPHVSAGQLCGGTCEHFNLTADQLVNWSSDCFTHLSAAAVLWKELRIVGLNKWTEQFMLSAAVLRQT